MGIRRNSTGPKAGARGVPGLASRGGAALAFSLAAHGLLACALFVIPTPPTGEQARQRVPLRMIDRPDRALAERSRVTEAPVVREAGPRPIAAPPGTKRPPSARPIAPPAAAADRDAKTSRPDDASATEPPPPAGPIVPGNGAGTGGTGVPHGEDDAGAGEGGTGATPRGNSGGAGSGGGIDRSDPPMQAGDRMDLYVREIRRRFDAVKRFPEAARRRDRDGLVVLRVRVESDGRVASTTVESPSGWPELDRAALATAARVGDLPPPPAGPIEFTIPLRFTLHRW